MILRILLISICFFALVTDYEVLEDNVTKADVGVDFTWHSHVDTTKDGKFIITNFIRNNSSDRPLSVKWSDADIACIGIGAQLDAGMTDYGNTGGILDAPFLFDKSEAKYGLTLQYAAPARIYVDEGTLQPKRQVRVSEYERQDKNGIRRFKIEITSVLEENQRSAEVTIRVVGGLNLILPPRLGAEIKKIPKDQLGDKWNFTSVPTIQKIQFEGESTNDFIQEWFGYVPNLSSTLATSSDYVVLNNQAKSSNELSLTITGAKWELNKTRLIAFYPDKKGAIGFAADLYLPK